MKLSQLKSLIKQGESKVLEFKKSSGLLTTAMQTVCAFLWENLTTNDCNITDLDKKLIQQVVTMSVSSGRLTGVEICRSSGMKSPKFEESTGSFSVTFFLREPVSRVTLSPG